jgi:hypothetical protein
VRAYRQGGLLDLMEQALEREDERQSRDREVRQSFADYELHLKGGARDAAIEALRRCVAAAETSAEYRRLLDELESRLVAGGRVVLQLRRGERLTATSAPLVAIGRDPLCDLVLRSAGVSRRHAEIEVAREAGFLRFALRDAGSRNGTTLGGLPIAGAMPLGRQRVVRAQRRLRDRLRGQRGPAHAAHPARARPRPDRLCAAEDMLVPLSTVGLAAAVRFQRGRPILLHPDGELTLNGERLAAGDVQLLHGDHLTVAGVEIEVM